MTRKSCIRILAGIRSSVQIVAFLAGAFAMPGSALAIVENPDRPTPQKVFLDFGADANAVFAANNPATFGVPGGKPYSKPVASLGTGSVLDVDQIKSILDYEQNLYNTNYFVDFTTTRPSGDYSTIYIGGTRANIPGNTIADTINGISQMRDYGNQNKSDSAVVFSGNSRFNDNIEALEQVIAHETGHLLGLAHVTDPTRLMYTYTPATPAEARNRMAIGGSTPVAADGTAVAIVPELLQDSNALLECYVGSKSHDTYFCTPSALAFFKDATFRRTNNGNSLASAIYDAKLVIPSGDDDSGATIFDLGTLTPGQDANFLIPNIPGLQGFLMGASIAGGPVDTFSGSPSGISGDPADFGTFAQELIDGNLALYQLAGSDFNPLGQISLSLQDSGVPEPGTLWLMLGVLALFWGAAAQEGVSMTRKSRIRIVADIFTACSISHVRAVIAPLLHRIGRDAAVAMLSVFMGITAAHAGVITFNDLIFGQTVYNFDANGDGKADARFSTTDPLGFRTAGPGPNMTYIQEPGLEGTSTLPVDLRIDFLSGTNSLKFGFALNNSVAGGSASATVYDRNGAVLASTSVGGQFTPTPSGQSSFPEGQLSLSFAKTAAYATLDFTSNSRYIIDNVSIGTLAQTVFLDFGANANAVFAAANAANFGVQPGTVYSKPAASLGAGNLTSADIDSILNYEQNLYNKYLVNFTKDKPLSGDFSTIFIGGTKGDVSPLLTLGATINGISQMRDYGNQNKSDSAVVFSGNPRFDDNIDSLKQVIAHETGHLLGLAHVIDPTQLMYTFTPTKAEAPGRSTIGGSTPVAADGTAVAIVPELLQDSKALLDCFVGSRSLADYICSQSAKDFFEKATARTSGTDLKSAIYDAKLVIANGDDDAGATIFDLGTLTPGQGAYFDIPKIPGLQGFFTGASTPGGPVDIFSGNPSGISGDPEDFATFAQELIDSNGNLIVGNLALYQLAGGVFNREGEISLSPQDAPEPGTLWLMLGVLAWLLFGRGSAKARRRSFHLGRRLYLPQPA